MKVRVQETTYQLAMRWSWLCCQRRVVWRCLLPVFYALSSAIIVLQMAPSLVTMLTAKGRMPAHIFLPQFSDVTGYKKHTNFNQPDCSIFDFLTKVDPTAMTYDRSIFCSPESRSQDVFCKLFFIQVGLRENGDCNRDTDDSTVPRFVYYVIFGHYEFHFWNYISFVAARRNFNCSALYVIGDAHPVGYWWQRVLRDVKGVRFIYRVRPLTIGNQTVNFVHHVSDLVRLQALLLNGGIYLDADMVITRPLDPILHYDITMGLVDNGTGMGNAFIAAKRNSEFVREWYDKYNEYKNKEYYKNSLQVPRDMWHRDPKRLHMESARLYNPNWYEADKLFKLGDFDWSDNYAIHVWTNGNPVPQSESDIQTTNTTIAQIFRYVLYGDKRPRLKLK